jgi:hypothetical protein
MSGGYGYPQYGPPRPAVAVPRVVAAALFALAAGLALGGSFGTFSVYGYETGSSPARTTTTTGWSFSFEPAVAETSIGVVLTGVALSVAAVLALVVALLLVLTARRREDPAVVRSLGVGSGGLLVGTVLAIWMDLVASARNVATTASRQDNIDAGFRSIYAVGVGAYLTLGAALVALAAAVLLLVARGPARAPVPPGTGPFPASGPGPGAPPRWQPAPQPWSQPGPGAPPPEWGPPHRG